MNWHLKRLAAGAVAAATMGTTLVAIPGASASAVAPATACSPLCGVIEGIGGVNVRDYWGGLEEPVIGHANNQDQVTVYCWRIPGGPKDTINGDPYWDLLYDPNGYSLSNPSQPGVLGFVADAYVYTAGNIQTQVSKCNIPPG